MEPATTLSEATQTLNNSRNIIANAPHQKGIQEMNMVDPRNTMEQTVEGV
jgi:hypothetical protein